MLNSTVENWRSILGYEGLYEVSNLGRVRSLDRNVASPRGGTQFKRGRILRAKLNDGYLQVNLYKAGSIVTVFVHRLVAVAFLDAPLEGQITVNHKYGIKTDNRVSELEWASPLENVQHAWRTGLKNNSHKTKLTQADANEIRQLHAASHSISDIAHTFDVSYSTVSRIIRDRAWQNKELV